MSGAATPVRVLVVDDSAVVRQVLGKLFSEAPGFRLLAACSDPLFAQRAMATEWPDVVVLDVEMPRMDGISFLRQIMASRPTPVVICSTLTTRGAPTTLQALQAGAYEIVEKPGTGLRDHLVEQGRHLLQVVAQAAGANVQALARRATAAAPPPAAQLPADLAAPAAPAAGGAMVQTTERIVAIGTSTGGTVALEELLQRLPVNAPGLVIVQHMPEHFTETFANRLDSVCQIRVRQAADGDRILPGLALVAPGGRHLQVRRQGAQYHAVVRDGPPVSRHRPSVNVLFSSVAAHAGRNAVGIIMTGMGDDGARGLLEMKTAGATTFAQDEASCVVFGMPREAIKLGAVDQVLPLSALDGAVTGRVRAGRGR
ncbi:protein-glutamate methylesterase/protein-glutamine glutaminase [Pseudaquabacterium pictum]|uniref:Protein-glutamate methylesterase/protein-glutamine glutaminase n=1 Tax=Pseudaquabacterium pictum TaxID=2315236 RepID=A0A480AW22_9BURK|nr:chemotaxis response regulator protein-glutamate methylesterase [Rubrivivax pictus]GCL65919.1 chemotaxis response regulator protein-glutamate methylesterase of group 2 operon [Rubrivivax pictus]